MSPAIGVLVITHNEKHRIGATFDSIFAQLQVKPSVFISDNNSNDGTIEYVNSLWGDRSRITLRRESAPLKSVYEHSAAAYRYFLNAHLEIEYWIILNAGDSWSDPLYLCRLYEALKKVEQDQDNPYCSYPMVKVYSHLTKESRCFRNDFSSSHPLSRLLRYWLMPRYRQPLTLFFGLMNRKAMDECIEFAERIHIYRTRNLVSSNRSPEAEMFFSFNLLRKINYVFVERNIFFYGIHEQKNNSTSPSLTHEESIFPRVKKFVSILKAHSYPIFYYKRMKHEINYLDRILVLLLMPLKLLIEYIFNFLPKIWSRLLRFKSNNF
jgi:glycosyltransferase involved in cell wall biosynthesis